MQACGVDVASCPSSTMPDMRILHIVSRFYPDAMGTSERIYRSQPRDGFQHHIVKPVRGDTPREYEYDTHFTVHEVRLPDWKRGRWRNHLEAELMAKAAGTLVRRLGIQSIYGHDPLVCCMASRLLHERMPGIPLMYEPHELLHNTYEGRLRPFGRTPMRWLASMYFGYMKKAEAAVCKAARFIVSQTHALKKAIMDIYGVPAEKIEVAYNGMPPMPDVTSADELRAKYVLPDGPFAMYGGHLSRNNGLDKIIGLALQGQQIVVAGTGPYAAELNKLSERRPNLCYLGSISKADYLGILSLAGALLILREPTITNRVYLSLKCLDAMRLNKTILSSRLDIMEELGAVYPNVVFTGLASEEIKQSLQDILNARVVPIEHSTSPEAAAWLRECDWKITQEKLQGLYQSLRV